MPFRRLVPIRCRVLVSCIALAVSTACASATRIYNSDVPSTFGLSPEDLNSIQYFVGVPGGELVLRRTEREVQTGTVAATVRRETRITELDFVINDGTPGVLTGVNFGTMMIDVGSECVLGFSAGPLGRYMLYMINDVPFREGAIVTIAGVQYEVLETREVPLLYRLSDDLQRRRQRVEATGRTVN